MFDGNPNKTHERLVFSSLRVSAKLAMRAGLKLKQMRHLAEVAHFDQALEQESSKATLGKQLGIGATKVAELMRELREQFLDDGQGEYELPRQLLSLLWSTPQTLAQIQKSLDTFDPDKVEEALESLVTQERVEVLEGRTLSYTTTRAVQRLTTIPWMAKIDGLNTLMDHVHHAIVARLELGDQRAMVRNLTFQVAPEDAQELQTFYETQVIPFIIDLDAKAQQSSTPVQTSFSILWAPLPDQPQ